MEGRCTGVGKEARVGGTGQEEGRIEQRQGWRRGQIRTRKRVISAVALHSDTPFPVLILDLGLQGLAPAQE